MNGTQNTFGARFGQLVRTKREALGWTFANLALKVFGPADNTEGEGRKGDVYRLESGQIAKPRASSIKRYCDALDISQAEVDALRTPDQMPTVTQMRRLLAEREHFKSGKELTEVQVIGLAERVAENIPDFDAALRELDHALTVAEELKARSGQTSNNPDFIEDVFKEVQRLNDADRPDAASMVLERKLDQIDAQQGLILDALVEQHMLRQDAVATSNVLIQRVAREESTKNVYSKLRSMQSFYLEKFIEGQSRFMADMAVVLAKKLPDFAVSPDETTQAIKELATTLDLLGRYDQSYSRLQQSIQAYDSALGLIQKADRPVDWAMTQNNLGNALSQLGMREDNPDRLEQAVTAYQAALEVRTKEALPMDWAITQNNLGNALQELGKRDDSPDRLEQAVAAYRAALKVYTKEALPMDWAMTQNNLGAALQELGKREDSPDRQEQAVTAYHAALEVRTKEALPMDWAATQFNLCILQLALFDQTSGPDHLTTAQTHLDNATEIFTRAGASQYLKLASAQQADIDARRTAL